MSWQRTMSRAVEQRAEKQLLTADRKRRKENGQKVVSTKTSTPLTVGSIVTRTGKLKTKAEVSRKRRTTAISPALIKAAPEPKPIYEVVLAQLAQGADLKRPPRTKLLTVEGSARNVR